MTVEGKCKDIEITLLGTFWTIPTVDKNVTYVEGQKIKLAKMVKILQHLEDME